MESTRVSNKRLLQTHVSYKRLILLQMRVSKMRLQLDDTSQTRIGVKTRLWCKRLLTDA